MGLNQAKDVEFLWSFTFGFEPKGVRMANILGSPDGFQGNLSLLDIFLSLFSRGLSQLEVTRIESNLEPNLG